MKYYLFMFFFFSVSIANCQISNSNFEIWEPIFNDEQPENWSCNGISFNACYKIEIASLNYAVKMENTLPCVDSTNPSIGKSLGNGDLTQYFKVPSKNFSLSYDIIIDSIDNPASFEVRLINPGVETVFQTSHSELYEGNVKHDISLDYEIDSLLIRFEPVGKEKEMAEHDCDLGFISVTLDNVIAEATVNTDDLWTNKIEIYPNPSNGSIRVNNINETVTSLQVYDLYGRLLKRIQQSEIQSNSLHIEASTGVFYIKVFFENELLETQKIVVK